MSRAVLLGVGLLAVAGLGGAVAWSMRRPEPVLPARETLRVEEKRSKGLHPLHPKRIEGTALRLADTVVGARYSWGGGRTDRGWPQGAPGVHGGVGWDCGGVSLAFAAAMLRYRWDGRDLTARGIADICTPVPLGKQKPGDLAAYRNRHVTAVLTHAGPDGHSRVLSASGGGSSTNGNDPNATVRIHDRGDYRSDFLTYMRLPAVNVDERQAVTCMALHRILAGEPVPDDSRLDAAELAALLRERFGGVPQVSTWLEPALRAPRVSGMRADGDASATQRPAPSPNPSTWWRAA